MNPDPTFRPDNRASRGPTRLIAGLALVAVLVACGFAIAAWRSGHGPVTPVASTPLPTNSLTPSTTPAQTEASTRTSTPTARPTRSASPSAAKASPKPTANQTRAITGPYRLSIPRIGVYAAVISIQSNQDRVLVPPRDPSVIGWWRDGAAPGAAQGSAVLVGHSVHNGGGGVFDHIGDLRRGDAIDVDGSDATLTYHVQSNVVLSKDELAREAAQIFAQTGAGRLVLITCGDWDGRVWRSNVVTIAAPASQ